MRPAGVIKGPRLFPVQTILHHVLELQRLDTQEQIAKNSSTTTLFIPYRGGTDNDDMGEQILRGNIASNQTRRLIDEKADDQGNDLAEDIAKAG